MLIPVIYKDGRQVEVTPSKLDQLIKDKEITCFKRSDGWVDISKDPIRKNLSRELL